MMNSPSKTLHTLIGPDSEDHIIRSAYLSIEERQLRNASLAHRGYQARWTEQNGKEGIIDWLRWSLGGHGHLDD